MFVIEILWEMLENSGLLLEADEPKHLLWAPFFMKTYLKQGHARSVVGSSSGAVDPKKMQELVWAFIETASESLLMK